MPTITQSAVLLAVSADHALAGVLNDHGYSVVQPPSGTLALEWARDIRPDVVILDAELPDMTGSDACWLFRSDPHVGRNVPILLLSPEKPSPEQRVTALRAGAWDFLRFPGEPDELALKLETYVQAKRNIDAALADGPLDPATGLHSRTGLARRARELGALMARKHGAFACVAFALDIDPTDARAGGLMAQAGRVSDAVGVLAPGEFALIAPGTDRAGAIRVAHRVADLLCDESAGMPLKRGETLHAGYAAVANFKYSPVDPVALLARAGAAVRGGKPEPEFPWLRGYELVTTPPAEPEAHPRVTPAGLVLESRRTSP